LPPCGHADIWIYSLTEPVPELRLTVRDHNTFPIWSSDGKRIVFLSVTSAGAHMVTLPSDGGGRELQPDRVTTGDASEIPFAMSPNDALLLFRRERDLWLLDMRDRKARPWLPSPFQVTGGRFSPDGRWIAYAFDQTGSQEIWVRPFPGPGVPKRVSSEGGHDPVWSHDGNELFYQNGDKILAARVVSTSPEFRVDPSRVLFEGGFMHDDSDLNLHFFDVAPDGRFLVIAPSGTPMPASLVVVQHWDQELNRLLSLK
jgi:Tol biopolymer transport system component